MLAVLSVAVQASIALVAAAGSHTSESCADGDLWQLSSRKIAARLQCHLIDCHVDDLFAQKLQDATVYNVQKPWLQYMNVDSYRAMRKSMKDIAIDCISLIERHSRKKGIVANFQNERAFCLGRFGQRQLGRERGRRGAAA